MESSKEICTPGSSELSLIDLDSRVEIKWNSVPLVPLPQSDSPLDAEALCWGDNPFDNASMEAMKSVDDPFEIVSLKAEGKLEVNFGEVDTCQGFLTPNNIGSYSKDFGGKVQKKLFGEDHSDMISNETNLKNYEQLKDVDLLSHLRKNTNKHSINYKDNYLLRRGYEEYTLVSHDVPTSSANPLLQKHRKDFLWNGLHTLESTPVKTLGRCKLDNPALSPVSYVRARVKRCIDEAREIFPSSYKQLDFSPLASSVNRRRSLDSLKRDEKKFSPYPNPRRARKSVDWLTGCMKVEQENDENIHLQRAVKYLNDQSNEFYSDFRNSQVLYDNKVLGQKQISLSPGISSLKCEGFSCPQQDTLGKKMENYETHLYDKIVKIEDILLENKLLEDESIIEFHISESDEDTRETVEREDKMKKEKSSEVYQASRSTPQRRQGKVTEEFTPKQMSKKRFTPGNLKSLTGGTCTQQKDGSAHAGVNRNVSARILRKPSRSRSDGNISPYLSSRDTSSKVVHTRSVGRVTKPLKSLGKVFQKKTPVPYLRCE